MLWCRVYRRAFIERYSFRFDENLRMGEDISFNLIADSLVDYICALPQLIGYYHREWNGSIIQFEIYQNHKEEEMLQFSSNQSFKSVESILFHLSNYAIRYIKRNVEKAQQQKERNMLTPVLQRMRVMAPRFTYTRNRILGMHAIVNEVLTPPTEARLRQLHETLETPISE